MTLDVIRTIGDNDSVIRWFRDKDTEALYNGRPVRRFQAFRRQAERRLQIVDSAASLGDLAALPSNRFEALAGRRKGRYPIRINRRWRVCFAWRDDEACDVEIVDYHR